MNELIKVEDRSASISASRLKLIDFGTKRDIADARFEHGVFSLKSLQIPDPKPSRSGKAQALKSAFRAADSIRLNKTDQGKRKAILRWCAAMKEVLK